MPHNCEDLRSIPRAHIKMSVTRAQNCKLRARDMETEGPSLESPATLVKVVNSKLTQKARRRVVEDDT